MASTNNERIKKFDGSERHDWPDFAKKMIAYGGLKGGWDETGDKDGYDSGCQCEAEQASLELPNHHAGG